MSELEIFLDNCLQNIGDVLLSDAPPEDKWAMVIWLIDSGRQAYAKAQLDRAMADIMRGPGGVFHEK